MEKRRFFRILAHAPRERVADLAREIEEQYPVAVLKEPQKSLVMIQVREPVQETRFYLGEALVCEAMVEVDGVKGMAVTLGDDFEKVLAMAVLDAAFNRKVPQCAAIQQELYRLEEEQRRAEEQENGLYHRTQVHFESLDNEVPHEDHP